MVNGYTNRQSFLGNCKVDKAIAYPPNISINIFTDLIAVKYNGHTLCCNKLNFSNEVGGQKKDFAHPT